MDWLGKSYDASGAEIEFERCYCGDIPIDAIKGIYMLGTNEMVVRGEELSKPEFKKEWDQLVKSLNPLNERTDST